MKLQISSWRSGFAVLSAAFVLGGCTEGSDETTVVSPDAGTEHSEAISVAGLSAPVRAVYDENGFLHISAQNDEDAFAALGYFHAANRFFFMDFVRHAVRGTLGELISAPGIVDRDVMSRTFFATRQGEPLPEKLVADFDAATAAVYEAYARGVNAWLADVRAQRNGATLTEEYAVLSPDLRDWEPADSAAVGLFSLNDLSNFADVDIQLGQVAQKAQALAGSKPAVAKALQDLFLDFRPAFDAYTLPAANQAPELLEKSLRGGLTPRRASSLPSALEPRVAALLGRASQQLSALPGALGKRAHADVGSNNWVISGSLTSEGHALLANDPHLQLTNPSIWFPVEIDGKTGGSGQYHAAGGSFPGIPAIQIGHNEAIAWGTSARSQ